MGYRYRVSKTSSRRLHAFSLINVGEKLFVGSNCH